MARHGSAHVVKRVREALPEARLAFLPGRPKSPGHWLEQGRSAPNPPAVLLGGGGDGTMVGLLNQMRELELSVPCHRCASARDRECTWARVSDRWSFTQ